MVLQLAASEVPPDNAQLRGFVWLFDFRFAPGHAGLEVRCSVPTPSSGLAWEGRNMVFSVVRHVDFTSPHCAPNFVRLHPMIRWVSIAWFLLPGFSVALAQAPVPQTEPSPAATAAKAKFEQLSNQWADLYVQLQKKSQAKGTDGEVEQLTEQIEGMVDKIVAAGLDAHRAGLTNDPTVNSTLIEIAGFHVTGDSGGDGGDQYEKALPVIKSMLEAGLGKASPRLWLWGGVSAFNLNEFDLAEKYFAQARANGLLGDRPPGQGQGDPLNRVWQLGKTQSQALPATRQAWQKEKRIRAQEAAADDLPRVKFHTTRGDITIELFENEAPIAVANFLSLVKSGYYDGVVFHRVLPAFMAQGGDPTGTGSGGPGYSIRCECQAPDTRKHFRGSMSMAHAGRDTGGSQFFLTFVPTSYLDGRHTVFGRVIDGMDAASALKRRNPQSPGPKPKPDTIIKAHVVRDRGHEYQFEKLPGK